MDTLAPPPTEAPSEFYNNNPLEIDNSVNYVIVFVTPALIIYGLFINAFGLETMQSRFLRDMTSQPMIQSVLALNCLLMITGPFCLWIMQLFDVYITEKQVYPCFMLRWSNMAIMLSTSWLLVLWITERVVTIGKPEAAWAFWRKTFKRITILFVILALAVTLSGLLFTEINDSVVCLPWLDIRKSLSSPNRHKAFSMMFSLGPSITFFTLLVGLMMALSLLSYKVHKASQGMNHYHTMLVEIKTTMHLKFISSLVWIVPLFVLTCAPIGLLIFMNAGRGFLWSYHLFSNPGMRIDWGGVQVIYNTTAPPGQGKHWGWDEDDHYVNNITKSRSIRDDYNSTVRRTSRIEKPKRTNIDGSDRITNVETDTQVGIKSSWRNINLWGNDNINNDDGVVGGDGRQSISQLERIVAGGEKVANDIGQNMNKLKRKMNRSIANRKMRAQRRDIIRNAWNNDDGNKETKTKAMNNAIPTNLDMNETKSHINGANSQTNGTNSHTQNTNGMEGTRSHNYTSDVAHILYPKHNHPQKPIRRRQPPLRNIECLLWFLYYTFSWAFVPILLVTEPLFRREFRGKWYTLKSSFMKNKEEKLEQSNADEEQEMQRATMDEWKKTMTLDPTTNTNLETFVNENNYFDQVRSNLESSVDVIVAKGAHVANQDRSNLESSVDVIVVKGADVETTKHE